MAASRSSVVADPSSETQRPPRPRARIAALVGDVYREREGLDGLEALLTGPEPAVWIDLVDPDERTIEATTAALRLHPLVAEDIVEGNQRSKIELTEEHIHIVLFVLRYGERMSIDEVDVVVGKGFILTAHGTDWDPWETQHLRDGVEPVLRHGPDHLLWALLDAIVDDYFPFIDRIGDVIDELQDEVVRKGSRETLERIFELKRDLMTIRRAVNPVREILNQLTNRELALIAPHEVVWFRDVYDHLIRLADEVDNQRELVSGTLDVYLSTVNNNLSVIMKRLTGVTVIIAGVGSIAGLFGMSEAGAAFQGGEAGGFWLVVLGSVGLAGLAAFVLRRIGWI